MTAKLYDVFVAQKQYGVVSVWADSEEHALAEGVRYARWLGGTGMLELPNEPDPIEAVEAWRSEMDDIGEVSLDPSSPAYRTFNLDVPKEFQ